MTEKRIDIYEIKRPSAYLQQRVVNPASQQSPNNARYPVWRLSKPYQLRKYENPPRLGDDGRGRRGDPTPYQFMCNIQPINRNEREYELEVLRQGDRSRALIYVTYDPFIANSENPLYNSTATTDPMYAVGIFIRLADQRTVVGEALGNTAPTNDLSVNHAHSDILEYDGQLWEALWTDLHNGGDEDRHGYTGRICHAIMGLFRDDAQERHSSITNRKKFDGIVN